MDLTKQYPRSPYSEIGGFVMLGRTVDKARAHNAEKLGEYIYDCPLDRLVFEFLGVSPEDLAEAVKENSTDEEIMAWVTRKDVPRDSEAVREFNMSLKGRAPVTEEQKQRFKLTLEKFAPGRKDVSTWFDLIDAEEGRLP